MRLEKLPHGPNLGTSRQRLLGVRTKGAGQHRGLPQAAQSGFGQAPRFTCGVADSQHSGENTCNDLPERYVRALYIKLILRY
jgi:hypothetical protein